MKVSVGNKQREVWGINKGRGKPPYGRKGQASILQCKYSECTKRGRGKEGRYHTIIMTHACAIRMTYAFSCHYRWGNTRIFLVGLALLVTVTNRIKSQEGYQPAHLLPLFSLARLLCLWLFRKVQKVYGADFEMMRAEVSFS